jgi:asparagine synthase (glutamine-hydrolysing)
MKGQLHRRLHPALYGEQYPPWLNPDLEKRFNLRDRWKQVKAEPPPNNAVRPEAYDSIASHQATVQWVGMFEAWDAGGIHHAIEVRHPFFDVRVVQFLLALPALPWCSDKEILRQAARGFLPDAVRLRRKTTMSSDPVNAALQRPESEWVDHFEPAPNFRDFVIQGQIPQIFGMQNSLLSWVHLRPLTLNFWLQRLQR